MNSTSTTNDDDGPLRGGIFHINDLRSHRYFRHVVDLLSNHPHKNELISLHASVIVRGGSILSIGYNKPSVNGFVRAYRPHRNFSVHSEADAIMKARKKINLVGSKIYIARVQKNETRVAISAPCPTCQEMLFNYGISRALYTTYTGEIDDMRITNNFKKVDFQMAAA